MIDSPRGMLTSKPNPNRHKTYIVSIAQPISLNRQDFMFGLRYVPDKLILDHGALAPYLKQVSDLDHAEAENLAPHILEDIMDQIVPRWIEINLRHEENKFGQNVLITMEDRQPGWDQEALLKRLPAIF